MCSKPHTFDILYMCIKMHILDIHSKMHISKVYVFLHSKPHTFYMQYAYQNVHFRCAFQNAYLKFMHSCVAKCTLLISNMCIKTYTLDVHFKTHISKVYAFLRSKMYTFDMWYAYQHAHFGYMHSKMHI
jgi:hypothetical protein